MLDLLRVGASLGVELKMGVQSRPGQEKESKPSFSVFQGKHGLNFKDHATGDGGGSWNLVKLLRPEWSNKEVAEHLIRLAGMDPAEGKMSNRQLREDLTRKRTEAARKHFRSLTDVPALPAMASMAPHVRLRYKQGWDGLGEDAARREELAKQRGWLPEWVEDLRLRGLLSDPVLPWHVPGQKGSQRGFAFLVQLPKIDARGRFTGFLSVGYHQRFRTAEGHSWLFVPHRPKREPKTDMDKALASAGQSVAPLPFVIGDPNAHLWVILEGQWDAATFFYVWNHLPGAPPVFVLGVRGSNGTGVFLAAWARLLKCLQPDVWCITDNDDAGLRWSEPAPHDPAEFRPHTFIDQLRAHGASRVAHSRLPAGAQQKDFNDWFALIGDASDACARVKMNYKQAFPEAT